jgi:23S rRNA (uracil1939-C5)-methyltransferase
MHDESLEIFETEISKLVTGGAGLGRCGDVAAFVPLTAPGDRVRARVRRRKKDFVEAELVDLLEPSPERQQAPCPHFGDCGGCDLQHMTGVAQRLAKAEIVRDCFQRLAGIDVTEILIAPDPAGPELGYRNKIRLFASLTGLYGLMRRGSHDVVPLETCLQMPQRFTTEILPWLRTLPPMEQLLVRLDNRGNFLVSMFGRPNRARVIKRMLDELPAGQPPLAGCSGLVFNNLPLWGRDYLVMEVVDRKYRVGTQSFFQANLAETVSVIDAVRDCIARTREPGGLLVDLFCGVGLFSLALSDWFEHIVAVDSDSHVIHDARNNVERDRETVPKTIVHEKRIESWLAAPEIPENTSWMMACVLVDPPRKGLGEKVTTALAGRKPKDIIYLSCDPATLARDTAALVKSGYRLERLRIFDMFPQTAHIETLMHLTRA